MSEEILSPSEAKVKFQGIADSEFAEKLQQEEFTSLKGVNVSTSHTRHQNVTVGSRVANRVAIQEETLNMIVETERLKREEMDRTLANKLIETKEVAGVQTWLSRELIGFNHTKNRIQELRADEQMAQNIQDGEMAAMLQEKEDKQLANQMTETALAEESTVNLARSLSKPAVDSTSQFTRTGSGSMVHTQNQSQMSRSRTFGFKTVSPVLNQKSRPPVAKKSNNYVQSVMEPVRDTRPIGLVPQVGHPFLQTPEDQQLFKEREKSLDGQSNPSVSVRPDPPSYSQINQSNLSLQSEPPASDQSDSLPVPQVPANYLPVSDQSAVELQEEPTPLPPPPFSGVSPSKLRHNKKRK